MKRRITLLLTIVLALIAVPAFSEMTKKDLQKMYMEFLTNEGYRPSIDSDAPSPSSEGGDTASSWTRTLWSTSASLPRNLFY
jgi:hypothetical protein